MPYGIRFCTNRTTTYHCNGHSTSTLLLPESPMVGFEDYDTWEAHSYDHAFLSIYHNISTVSESLKVAQLVADKYRLNLKDQWDYRDLSSTYPDAPGEIRPVCNSHYSRQLIFWSIPLVLSGQRYDVQTKTLIFNPKPGYHSQWPILLPSGVGIMTRHDACYKLHVLFGKLEASYITISGEILDTNGGLKTAAGDTKILCSDNYN